LPRIRTLRPLPAEFGLEAVAGIAGTYRRRALILRDSTCMSACRERARMAPNFIGAWLY
jgi:hypothetical protein